MTKFKVGDYVRVKGNAPGTVWETGIIVHINKDGVLIAYGSKNTPPWARLYGLGIRIPLSELEKVKT